MEKLIDAGRAAGRLDLSDVVLENLVPLYEAARIKPAVVQEWNRIRICRRRSCWNSAGRRGLTAAGLCALGSWHTTRPAGRPGDSGHRQADLADARASPACVGHPTGNSRPDHGENSGARAGELQPLGDPRSGRERNQPDSNPKPAQLGGDDRGSRFHQERRVRFKFDSYEN